MPNSNKTSTHKCPLTAYNKSLAKNVMLKSLLTFDKNQNFYCHFGCFGGMSYKEILEHTVEKHQHEAKIFYISIDLAKKCL